MATTTNYGWTTPNDTDLVKDGAAAIRTLGSSIDTTTKNLNPETTAGDIAYRSATTNTNTRLAIGSTGQILTVAAGVPSWATPAGGGGYTELATGSLSGSDLTLTSISGSYIDLRLYLSNIQVSTATNIKLQINGVTASTYAFNALTAVDAGVYRTQLSSNISTGPYSFDSTGSNNTVAMEFRNYAVANALKTVHGVTGSFEDSNDALDVSNFVGTVNSSAAITSLKVFPASGTFTGSYKLYGVK